MKATEILKKAKEENIKYISLSRSNGEVVVPMNNQTAKIEQRAKEIEQVMKSDLLPDGTYFLDLRRSPKSNPFQLELRKGKVTVDPIRGLSSQTENVLSFEAVLKLNKQISDLEYQVTILTAANKRLQDEIEELTTEEPEEVETLADRAQNWLADMAEMVAPIIDKHYNLKEREIAMKEAELFSRIGKKGGVDNSEVVRAYEYLVSIPEAESEKGISYLQQLKETNMPLYISLQKYIKDNEQN